MELQIPSVGHTIQLACTHNTSTQTVCTLHNIHYNSYAFLSLYLFTSHLVYADTIRLAVVWLSAYTKCDVQLIKLLLIVD